MSRDRPPPPARTFLSPEGLLVLAAAGATAAAAAMPIVLLPGAMAYGILTWMRYERWKGKGSQVTVPAAALAKLAPAYRERVLRCLARHREILAEIASAEGTARGLLQPTAERVRSLAEPTVDLASRLQQIRTYLEQRSPAAAAAETKELRRRIEGSTDDVARERLQRALEQQVQKVEVLEELKARADRIDAQLTNIEMTFETVAAQVVRIKSAEAATASDESARVLDSLRGLAADVKALSETAAIDDAR